MAPKWKIAAMVFAIAALNYADRTAIASVFPLLRADLGITDAVIAGIGSLFLWSYAIGSPFAGHLADRFSRTRIVIISLLAWSTVTALTALVHSSSALLLTRVLLGLTECAYLPAAIALLAEHHGPETRATAIGFHIAGMNLGLIGGSALAGYLGQALGWRMDFVILGATGFALAIGAVFVLRDAPRDISEPSTASSGLSGVWHLLHLPAYVAVIASAMLISIGTWMFLNWLPLYVYDRFHLSLAMSGLSSSSLLQAAAILGAVLGGYISDRFTANSPSRRVLFLSLGYFCAAPFLLTFLGNSSLAVLNVSIFSYSFLKGIGSVSECPIICEVAGPRLRSTGLGILNMMNCLAGGVGIAWAGFLKRDYGLGLAFGTIPIYVVLAAVVVLAAYRIMRRREQQLLPDPEPVAAFAPGRPASRPY